jgi:hypothetical protein
MFLLAVLLAGSPASAQLAGTIGVFGDAEGNGCSVADESGLAEIHVIHYGHSGATAVQFMLTVIDPNWYHISDEWVFPLAIGNSSTGVAIAYGACMPAPTYLGKVIAWGAMGTGTPCADILVLPDPNVASGMIEAVDCAQSVMYPYGVDGRINCGPCMVLPPYDLLPADGASAVSLAPTLYWSWDPPEGCREGLGITQFTVLMGTDPDDLHYAAWSDGGREAVVYNLQPGTVYYWQVRVNDSFWECPGSTTAYSVVQTFTTEGPVPAKQTTWGRLKSLFR